MSEVDIIFKIDDLKNELKKTDFKVIKFIEEDLSQKEFNEVKKIRKEIRKQINELEGELNGDTL